jgi:hypothetical protein
MDVKDRGMDKDERDVHLAHVAHMSAQVSKELSSRVSAVTQEKEKRVRTYR